MKNLFKSLQVRENVPMKGFSSFRIGGVGRYLVVANSIEEVRGALDFAQGLGIRVYVLGAGTNLLFGDGELNYVFIKLGKGFSYLRQQANEIVVGASLPVFRLVRSHPRRLSIFSGLPGTVGGAVKGNAGVRVGDRYVGFLDVCQELRILDQLGRERVIETRDISKGYRRADIDGIILEARLVPEKIKDYWGILPQRPLVEPFPNVGCIFKNPKPDLSAGKLIEELGFKGRRRGGAMVSELHANFILNVKEASFADVMGLIEDIKSRARQERAINLELEIQVVQ